MFRDQATKPQGSLHPARFASHRLRTRNIEFLGAIISHTDEDLARMQAKVGTNHRSSSAWIGTVAELLLFVVLLPGADSSNPTEIIGGEQDRGARLQGALVVLGQDDEVDNAVFPLMHHGTCRPESGHDLFCRADESPGSRHGSAFTWCICSVKSSSILWSRGGVTSRGL
jgi:hypothetical protein